MADKNLTALTAASAFAATDLLMGKVGSDSRKISGTVLSAFLATATLAAGTLTTSQPMTLTQTWNDAGVTFTGFKVNITSTAAAAASKLLDIQKGSISAAFVSVGGSLNVTGLNDATNPTINFLSGATNQTTAAQLASEGATSLTVIAGGLRVATFNASLGPVVPAAGYYGFSSTADTRLTPDLALYRDAANTLAQRNGTASQTANLYDTWASATDYHRVAKATARATLSGVTGASVTATGLIPAGAKLIGVTSKVTTGLGNGNGTTGYAVGTVADPNLWGDVVGVAAGTSSAGTDATADPAGVWSASARDVIVTAAGGDFDGTGVIYLAAFYEIVQAD